MKTTLLVSCWIVWVASAAEVTGVGDLTQAVSSASKSKIFPNINPPPLPPVAQFTELLRATPENRTNRLAGKSPAARSLILRELAQFDALPGAEREQRVLQLRVAQLRYYLRPLLRCSVAARAAMLAGVPSDDRSLIETRLVEWDQLAPASRQEILESDESLRMYVGQASPGSRTDAVPVALPLNVPADVRRSWERWQTLTSEERDRREAHFRQFFDLSSDEQSRVLGGLPLRENQRMERVLARFNGLPADRREICVQNFDRLARLPEAERAAFLRNAAKWEAMTQSERDAWRRLVTTVPPPPMPPVAPDMAGGK